MSVVAVRCLIAFGGVARDAGDAVSAVRDGIGIGVKAEGEGEDGAAAAAGAEVLDGALCPFLSSFSAALKKSFKF